MLKRYAKHRILHQREADYDVRDPEAGQQQKLSSADKYHRAGLSNNNKFSNVTFVLLASLSVSLFIHKIVHLLFDPNASYLDYSNPLTYIWLPSVFTSDFVTVATFASVVLFVSGPTTPNIKSRIVLGNLCMYTLLAFLITVLESTFLITQRDNFDWTMLADILYDWQSMKMLLVAGTSKSSNNAITCMVCVCLTQVVLTYSIVNTTNKKRIKVQVKVIFNKRMIMNKKRKMGFVLLLAFSAINLQNISRPAIPYNDLSHTPIISVLKQVKASIEDKQLFIKEAKFAKLVAPQKGFHMGHTGAAAAKKTPQQEPAAVNVVLIILESVRADLMPFDPSTAWAEQYIKWRKKESLTPFYESLTKDPSALHVHHKSASGITHKALVSLLCSLYANPQKLTQEHKSNFYHQCLPRLLESSGLTSSPFFQSQIKYFDHWEELLHHIGYEKVYALEDYELEHNPEDQWKEDHRASEMTYEDDVFIKPMMNWIDKTTERKSSSNSIEKIPFFATFLTGLTHWPYPAPPKGADWNMQNYAGRPMFNALLNAIAYTDRFLMKVFDEFEERGLMNSTLFVIAGDHGVNFKHRRGQVLTSNQEGEESFDVAVTFYSSNKQIAERIATVRNGVPAAVEKSSSSWSSIDIVPTILDLLNVFGKTENGSLDILNGSNAHSIVDGRSMLHPSSNRLTFSIGNPGDLMVLRDRSYVIFVPNYKKKKKGKIPKVWDLSNDPQQKTDTWLDEKVLAEFEKNKLTDYTGDLKHLLHWGTQALKFVERVEMDLVEAHRSGHRCTNCTLFLLNSLETLDEWVEFENFDIS